jgi:hypothetical protein
VPMANGAANRIRVGQIDTTSDWLKNTLALWAKPAYSFFYGQVSSYDSTRIANRVQPVEIRSVSAGGKGGDCE